MKFGFDQTTKPTPQKINLLFDLIVGVCGVLAGFATSATFIAHSVADVISSMMTALIIPILLLCKRFFGAEVDTMNVPVGDVKVIEEHKHLQLSTDSIN
jgi:tetrahydromethanopterin S-methyltransferase subunit E